MSKNWRIWVVIVLVISGLGVVAVVAPRSGAEAQGSGAQEAPKLSRAGGQAVSRRQLWHCGMHPQVVQDHPGKCPICHMALTPMNSAGPGESPGNGKQLWWDPMLGPSSITDHPGKSAMGMDLVPYTRRAVGGPAGEVTIDPAIVQNMGVQTAAVTRGALHTTVRAVGVFRIAEPGMHDIALKMGGWIDKLYADQEGMHVVKGQPLFALYSPELQVTEQELIAATKSRRSLPFDASATLVREADAMVNSARRKLALWDIDEREIDAIVKADQPPKDVTFYSSVSGHIEDKMVVQGSAVQAGMRLMRVADHTAMWLDVQVYEDQVPLVAIGQPVEVTTAAAPGKTFTGIVNFIYPHVDHMTRTLTVRATFENPSFELKPGMYAEATIKAEPSKDAILIPQAALIDTGTRQLVFVTPGEGHFAPRAVRAGIRGEDGMLQILDGLKEGETVVTSGQFLIDVESRLNESVAKLNPTSGVGPELMSDIAAAPATAPATRPADLALVYCPMTKADWVQPSGPIANPYMGEEMRDCGEIRAKLPQVGEGSALAPAVKAYLAVERSLVAGKADDAAIAQLKSAVARLQGNAYAPLRDATAKLAGAHDLNSARTQFKTVSEALIAVLKQQPSTGPAAETP